MYNYRFLLRKSVLISIIYYYIFTNSISLELVKLGFSLLGKLFFIPKYVPKCIQININKIIFCIIYGIIR